MSWFDATGLANIAKTALKEAQKTIDKALDIRDVEDEVEDTKLKTTINSTTELSSCAEANKFEQMLAVHDNEIKKESSRPNIMPTSNWGSFSGSFFQVQNSKNSLADPPLISTQPQKLTLILSDNNLKAAPLATPETELTPVDPNGRNYRSSENEENLNKNESSSGNFRKNEEKKTIDKGDSTKENLVEVNYIPKIDDSGTLITEDNVITRQRGRRNSSSRNSYISNRLSVVSTESDGKRSTESVEVLGSLSCTTSPDTDLPSVSTSSSLGFPKSSSCTDSVEVIDSATSPSSIEVLVEGTSSGRTTQLSCINSPKEESVSVNQNLKSLKMVSSPVSDPSDVSPESFEVIPDLPEYDEELSVADSYTSASESTGTTVVEPYHQYSYRMTESYTDLSQASSKFRSGDSTPDIGKLPSVGRNTCDILSESVHKVTDFDSVQNKSYELNKILIDSNEKTNQKSRADDDTFENKTDLYGRKNQCGQGSPTKRVMKSDDRNFWLKTDLTKSEIIKTHAIKKDVEEAEPPVAGNDIFIGEEISGSVSSYSDTRTIIANDSSCDEIALESSSEDAAVPSDSQTPTTYSTAEKLGSDGNHSHSYYVKNLLSEAMREMSTTRETSPTLSEKSRSDLVKVGSEQTSGHTSGDELETTTSSDIEIISRYSPNGDSSSTASRHSPAKLLHHNSKSKLSLVAVDILGKATQTKTKGHQREPSEASSFCSEDNSEVEKLSKRVTELTEILEARESRLNDLRKTNLEMQERNQELKREMEQAKREISSGLHALQTDSEKDALIKELKEEGEKLSKKELKQANLIKTLRAHEKSQQTIIDNNRTQIHSLMKSVEELKSELSLKKESEKSLNESFKQMSKKITRQDEEIANLMNQMEKAVVKAEELKYLLESKEEELIKVKELLAAEDSELQDAISVAETKSKQLERLKAFQESAQIELEDLKQRLKKSEEMHNEREKSNKEEKAELMRRLLEAEGRNEELAQSVSKATRPLLRQMEALQLTISHERESWEKQERNLLQKLEEAESHLSSVMYHEKSFKQETLELRTKVRSLEEQVQNLNQELNTWKLRNGTLSKQLEEAEHALESEKTAWSRRQEELRLQIVSLKEESSTLEQQLSVERANVEAERNKASLFQDQLKEKEAHAARDSNSPRSSPTLSFGRVSLSESLSSNIWPQFNEDAFDTVSVSGRCSNLYDNLRASNTAPLMESLQSQLKMRDGEISQLQWELQRRDVERMALTTELSSLTSKLEELGNKLVQAEVVEKSLKELQTNYDAMLEMYGEKVEEVEELRLDLQDVKEMYKSQIDQLLKKEKQDTLS